MGKYQSFQKEKKDIKQVSPIWTGIGFMLVLIVPIMAWAAAVVTLDYGLENGWPIPADLLGAPGMNLSPEMQRIPVFVQINNFMRQQENINAKILFAIVYLIFLSGIISTVYAFVYRALGPSRYSAVDAPPEPVRRKRRIR
jgi:hypothetical protein